MLFRSSGLPPSTDFYFVHSYHFVAGAPEAVTGTCEYGESFVAAVAKDNVWGVQFHPESIASAHGHALLQNFLRLARTAPRVSMA